MHQKILSEFGFSIKIAGEIEFYILNADENFNENDFLAKLLLNIMSAKIPVWQLQKEVALYQYEVALQPSNVEDAINNICKVKEIIAATATEFKVEACFEAKPFEDRAGCGLHIHIGMLDAEGNSVLQRTGEFANRESESETMLNVIGGLCQTMIEGLPVFAPKPESYKRFTSNKNRVLEGESPLAAYNGAPVNVSWGGNNRTTAIRIPVSTIDESQRHIEHRVAGADANPAQVIEHILKGIYIGLKEKPTPPQKIHGNAFDAQYDFLVSFV